MDGKNEKNTWNISRNQIFLRHINFLILFHMKKKSAFLFFCLFVYSALIHFGCDDEKEEIPQPTYFEDIANEHVVSTIENVPGMVYNEYDGYVFISCSEYVDEYLAYPLPNGTNLPATSLPPVDLSIWKVYPKDTTIPYDTNRRSFLLDEVTKDMIGVTAAEFREFDILLGSKVYVSASITNNVKENGSQNHSTKAYLLDLKERQ